MSILDPMIDTEVKGEHQAFADDLAVLIHSRIAKATPVELLSDRGDKVLQVLEESDGQTFVTRSFTDRAVAYTENRHLSFVESWAAMHDVFADAGLRVVPSHLLTGEGEYPFIAVSEHLGDAEPVRNAPVELKIQLARSMVKLIQPNKDGYFISAEMLNKDMFLLAKDKVGEPTITLVDTDPHILPGMYDPNEEQLAEFYVNKLADLFWSEWCTPDERTKVCGELLQALLEVIDMGDENFDLMGRVGIAMQNLHMMTNGVDIRKSGMFR